jgi:hypothetical protein
MTTNVKVEAHCGNDTEVIVEVTSDGQLIERSVLQDGEACEHCCYDGREVTAKEVKKEKPA